jgi:Calpain family cysteine protease
MSTTKNVPENVGVANPYSLAEVMLKRKIDWKRVANPQGLLEKTLGTPYDRLFDPKFDSPLYPGLRVHPNTGALERVEVPSGSKGALRTLVEVGNTTVWGDPGDFFEEAAELTDPIQGAVANCYYIAALSSVAWARTYVIAQRTRATGTQQQQFVDMIEFFTAGKPEKVEVTELIPLNAPGNNFIFARSSEAGEIWPAVYEKAFAKWKTKTQGDQPDITKTAYGDPVGACALLTGLTPYYLSNPSLTEDAIWQKVRENCISYKTFNPMVAWTYGTAPAGVNYANAHIVANHAYSILGWQFANNQKYIVLRNPWGTYEATLNVNGGTWIAWDAPYYGGPGWWRPVPTATNDGIFALRVDTFKSHFAGFGFVK